MRWGNWTLTRQTTAEVELGYVLHPQPGYPFTLELSLTYSLSPDGLAVTTTATNVGDSALPYACGQHPYLAVPARVDDCLLTLNAGTHIPTDDRGLPTGRESVDGNAYDFRVERTVGDVQLDTAFTDLERDTGPGVGAAGDSGRRRDALLGRRQLPVRRAVHRRQPP